MLLLSWSSLGEVGRRSYCTLAFCSPSVINFHHEASCGSSLIRDQSWRLRSSRAWGREQRCLLRASARTIFGREPHVFVFLVRLFRDASIVQSADSRGRVPQAWGEALLATRIKLLQEIPMWQCSTFHVLVGKVVFSKRYLVSLHAVFQECITY